jgi:hypothetical protein
MRSVSMRQLQCCRRNVELCACNGFTIPTLSAAVHCRRRCCVHAGMCPSGACVVRLQVGGVGVYGTPRPAAYALGTVLCASGNNVAAHSTVFSAYAAAVAHMQWTGSEHAASHPATASNSILACSTPCLTASAPARAAAPPTACSQHASRCFGADCEGHALTVLCPAFACVCVPSVCCCRLQGHLCV